MSILHNIVKKMMKYQGKIISMELLRDCIVHFFDTSEEISDTKIYKYIYQLKTRGYICSVRKDLFYIFDKRGDIGSDAILTYRYWRLLKKHCNRVVGYSRYVGGRKALELHMQNFQIIDTVSVYTKKISPPDVLCFDKKIHYSAYTKNDASLWSGMEKYIQKITVTGISLSVSCRELSMLESLYAPDDLDVVYLTELNKQLCRRYAKSLDLTVWEAVLSFGKHHSSINRLYEIARTVAPDLANKMFPLMKKYSYFLTM